MKGTKTALGVATHCFNVQVQPDCWLQYEQFEGKGTLAAYGEGTADFSF